MGIDINKVEFTAADFEAFGARLEQNLAALELTLADPDFGLGPGSLGAELEMYIVDARGKPLYVNQEILADANDPQLTLELNRYNLEFNLTPQALGSAPFLSTEREILEKLNALRRWRLATGGVLCPSEFCPHLPRQILAPIVLPTRNATPPWWRNLLSAGGAVSKLI